MNNCVLENKVENYDDILKLMTMLISTDTTNPPGNELVLVNKIISYLKLDYDEYAIINCGKNRANLVIDIPGKEKGKAIAFVGHLDTVVIGDTALWKYPPFGACFDGDFIYGRGASDMKGGVAAMIMLYKRLKKNCPKYPVKLVFTADEEKDGKGISAVCEHGIFDDVKSVVVCEPTSLNIGICEKGAIWFEFTLMGQSSHAAYPNKGVNALENGFAFLNVLKNKVERMSEEYPCLGKNSFQITQIKSGTQINVIPDRAKILVDVRTVPTSENENQNVINLVYEFAKVYCQKHADIKINIKVLGDREAISNDKNAENIKTIFASLNDMGVAAKTIGINYFTDCSIIYPKTHLPFAIIGPGFQEECHKVNEKSTIKEIIDAVELYYRLTV